MPILSYFENGGGGGAWVAGVSTPRTFARKMKNRRKLLHLHTFINCFTVFLKFPKQYFSSHFQKNVKMAHIFEMFSILKGFDVFLWLKK